MQNSFDMAYNSITDWSLDQCERMIDALRKRVADETDASLEAAGLFTTDLYQPISEDQFRQELIDAQAEYKRGEYMDALAFCEEMERP